MTIFVGSDNPVKINAVTNAVIYIWPEVQVEGLVVESGIAEQPMSDQETKLGAINRAQAVLAAGQKLIKSGKIKPIDPNHVLGVGLEGGVYEAEPNQLWSTVWVAVVDIVGNLHAANGAHFPIPPIIAEPILAGDEMGPVVSRLFKGKDVRRLNGAIGVVTKDFVNRTEEYSAIAKMAIGLWYGRDWEKDL